MNPFEFIISALVLVLGYKLVMAFTGRKEERRAAGVQSTDIRKLEEEIAVLDDRIQVLERIVTDGRYDLDQKIKDLGD